MLSSFLDHPEIDFDLAAPGTDELEVASGSGDLLAEVVERVVHHDVLHVPSSSCGAPVSFRVEREGA